jgi:MFS family permease
MALIPRIGGRWTMVTGALVFAAGFLLAAASRGLLGFYLAAGLLGLAFSLTANATGTYLIASWSGPRSPRMIGLYLMIGSLGGAAGPPVAEALIASSGGWRVYWMAVAAAAVLIAGLCALAIREPPLATRASAGGAVPGGHWQFGSFLRRPQFLVATAAMVATQACSIMVSSAVPPHLANLGWPDGFAASLLGLQGLVAAAATGISGWLTERRDPRLLLAAALVTEAAGMILLAFASGRAAAYGFVLVFGIGYAVSSLAGTVLLIRYFGSAAGTAALATVWLVAGIATGSPAVAGLVDDLTGSFVPALVGLGLLLLPIALAAVAMTPIRRPAVA